MSLRIAIVGCGNIAEGHVGEIARIPGAEVVALCDREPLMAEQLSVRFGNIPYDTDFARVLADAAPDVVHITTPPQSHHTLASLALDGGCHVLVEKPLALSAPEAQALVELARQRGRCLTVGQIYQFDPPALSMRRIVASGRIGEPVNIDVRYGYSLDGAFGKAVMGNSRHWVHDLPGKVFQNNLDHAVAKIVEFLPDADTQVTAVAYRRRDERTGDRRDEVLDELRVLIESGGVSGSVVFSSGARPVAHRVCVQGTRDTINVDLVARTVTFERAPRLPSALGRVLPAFSQGWEFHRAGWRNTWAFARSRFHYFEGMNELFRRFYDAIRSDGDPPIPYDQIVRTAWILDRINEQVYGSGNQGDSR